MGLVSRPASSLAGFRRVQRKIGEMAQKNIFENCAGDGSWSTVITGTATSASTCPTKECLRTRPSPWPRNVALGGGTVLDVGANIGVSTLAFAHIAGKGRVIAFEPSSRNFTLLLSNIEANGLTNVSAVKAALSNVESTVTLLEDPEFIAGNRVKLRKPARVRANRRMSKPSRWMPRFPDTACNASTLSRSTSRRLKRWRMCWRSAPSSTLEKFRPPCVIEFNSYTLVYHQHVAPMDFLTFSKASFRRSSISTADRTPCATWRGVSGFYCNSTQRQVSSTTWCARSQNSVPPHP